MVAATLEEILDVFKIRRKHCRDLLELSRQQIGVIQRSDYSRLLAILSHKQRILGCLDEIKRRHPELGRQWRSIGKTGPTALRSACESVLAETDAVVAELIQTENAAAEELSERRAATQHHLAEIAEGVHVNETYGESCAPVSHRFLDTDR